MIAGVYTLKVQEDIFKKGKFPAALPLALGCDMISNMTRKDMRALLFSTDVPPVLLAPMAGITDLVFRRICRSFGADGAVSEMVSAKALCFGDKKSRRLCEIDDSERPTGIQLFGHEPQTLAQAARIVCAFSPDWIDINMGCPVHKVVSSGDGSALMRDPKLIFRIVQAVTREVDLPVTVKLRAGIGGVENAVECAQAAQEGGAAAVAVHGRRREQFYAPAADWGVIARVKRAIDISVFANGDIDSPSAALEALAQTGADGLMVGRAALGNPFLFEQIKAALLGMPEVPPPSPHRRLEVARRHIHELVQLKGEHIGMLEARGHMGWYFKGMRGAASLREKCNKLTTIQELDTLIDEAISMQKG